jgi:gamma-glutamyl-gamma-aminobutyraldehyde dehydrogenase
MEFATLAFVDGGYRPAVSGNTFDSLIRLLAQNAAFGAEDVDYAVSKAAKHLRMAVGPRVALLLNLPKRPL